MHFNRRLFYALGLGTLWVGLMTSIGCGSGSAPSGESFINEQVFRRNADQFVLFSRGCINTGSLGPASPNPSGSEAPDFSVSMAHENDVVVVFVRSRGETLETRMYDRAFLGTANVDEFTVRTKGQDEYRLRYFGGRCDASVPPKKTGA